MRLRRVNRRVIWPAALAALVLVIALLAALSGARQGTDQTISPAPDYNVHSNGPDGTRALALWLAALGYRPNTLEYEPFRLRSSERLLFILFPSLDATGAQIATIDRWVEQGGTLVLASWRSTPLLDHFGIDITQSLQRPTSLHAMQPLLLNPPPASSTVKSYGELRLHDAAWVPLLSGENRSDIVAASLAQGDGQVIVLSTGDPFSNSGLKQPGNAALVLNLLAGLPAGSAVVIDEYHHGATEQGTLTYQLVRQPWGWAMLYLGLVLLLFTAFGGRRFGSVLKPYAHGARRARAEYATTLASLLHQGGHRDWLRLQYLEQVKRRLAGRFRVRANMATPAFVEELASRAPEAATLARPLEQLEEKRIPDDRALLALIRETEQIANQLIERPTPRSAGSAQPEAEPVNHD